MNPADSIRFDLKELIQALGQHSRDLVWFYDPDKRVFKFNRALPSNLGLGSADEADPRIVTPCVYQADRSRWQTILDCLDQGGVVPFESEIRLINPNRRLRWMRLKMLQLRGSDPTQNLVFGTLADIDDSKRMKQTIRRKSCEDSLTGLANRTMMDYKIRSLMASAELEKRSVTVILLDIDHFRVVNDRYDYRCGDQALRQVAELLVQDLPSDAAVFRVDGDEFAILLTSIDDSADIEQLIQMIMSQLAQPMTIEGNLLSFSAHAGVAIYPEDGRSADEIKNHATLALMRAKQDGGPAWRFFNVMDKQAHSRQDLLTKHLRQAIERSELHLVYQPQIDVLSGEMTGLETLLRWNNLEFGPVPPMEFIPLAESSGQMIAIGTWVLEAVGRQLREWLDSNRPIVPVAINISPVQLKDPQFLSMVRRILSINRLSPSLLEFEITESTFLDSNQCTLDLLDSLRQLGIRIALDDFGAGYSSLTYIRTMALDRLKIDRSFIKDMNERQTDKAIIRTIISLAHILNLEIVAEGVENHDQFDYLKKIGCNVAQGYLFSKPIPADQVAALFAR